MKTFSYMSPYNVLIFQTQKNNIFQNENIFLIVDLQCLLIVESTKTCPKYPPLVKQEFEILNLNFDNVSSLEFA